MRALKTMSYIVGGFSVTFGAIFLALSVGMFGQPYWPLPLLVGLVSFVSGVVILVVTEKSNGDR